jgi:hypothetical protein
MIVMTSPLDLASLLCSRLCHDMLSPVGALTNGLELLADEKDPEMRQRCFERSISSSSSALPVAQPAASARWFPSARRAC